MLLKVQELVLTFVFLVSSGVCWKCNEKNSVCEVWLKIEQRLTMMQGVHLVTIKDGLLYPYNADNFTTQNEIPMKDVITGDGWPEPRIIMAINGTVPGPLIEVFEGQTVRVHVMNSMMSETTTIHFHGIHQRGTPWMDGVPFLTQCPILPGTTFTYQFIASPAGTQWYHSHSGSQSSNGIAGGFIVHPRTQKKYNGEYTMLVTEYNHDWDAKMDYMKMAYGLYVSGKELSGQRNAVGGKYSLLHVHSALINGRGWYTDPTTNTTIKAPLETYNVQSNERHRFRVIHSGSVYPIRVSIHGHKLTVIATDGCDLREPVEADSVILTTGERYDFEVTFTQGVDNYWITAVTLELGNEHTGLAILHYEGAAGTTPTTKEKKCTASSPCVVVNCPFQKYPPQYHIRCINVEHLRIAEDIPTDVAKSKNVKEYFLNFAFPGITSTPASVNGIAMAMPRVTVLTQPLEFDNRCPGDGYRCGTDEQCRCAAVLDLANNDVVQMVFVNQGCGKGWDHPIHLHGHHFWVLKIGYPQYSSLGLISGDNFDINCRGNADRNKSFCNRATWADNSWSGNKVPGLNFDHPVLKDTVNVPTGGYVVVRMRADNPGVWAFHCHVSLHLEDGMMLMVNESYPLHPPPPKGFQKCGSFSVPYPAPSSPRAPPAAG